MSALNGTDTSAAALPPLVGAARHLHEPGLRAVAWAGVATAGIFVGLRLFARFREAGHFFADDYWVVAAFSVLTVNAVLQHLQTGSLYYVMEVSAGRLPVTEDLIIQGNIYVRYEFPIIGLMWTVLWCVKASLLALFWRLFEGLPRYRRVWWGVVVFCALSYIGCWIASAWTCHPPSTYFQFGACTKPIDVRGGNISISYSTAVDIISDLAIMMLPLRLLRDLQVSRPQKIGLSIVFCLGLAIIAVAIVRLTQIIGQERADPVGLAVWGLVESTVSVIIGCLPPLKSFLGKQLSKFTGAIYAYGGGGYAGGRHSGKIQGGSGNKPSFTSRSANESNSIPLHDRSTDVKALKDGQIVVQKDFGWSAAGGSTFDRGSSVETNDLESQKGGGHSTVDEHYYGDEVKMMKQKHLDEREIGVATPMGKRMSMSKRLSHGRQISDDARSKTSWLQ